MATTVMLLSVLTALVKALLFGDNRINDYSFFNVDTSVNTSKHYGIVTFGPIYNDDDEIRIQVDPDTLNVVSYWEVDGNLNSDGLDYIAITWDVKDVSSISRDIVAIWKNVNLENLNIKNPSLEAKMVRNKIRKAAENMDNKIINIKVD